MSITLNITFSHHLKNYSFDTLDKESLNLFFKDERVFSLLVEPWLLSLYPLVKVDGVIRDKNDERVTYTWGFHHHAPQWGKAEPHLGKAEPYLGKAEPSIINTAPSIRFPTLGGLACGAGGGVSPPRVCLVDSSAFPIITVMFVIAE